MSRPRTHQPHSRFIDVGMDEQVRVIKRIWSYLKKYPFGLFFVVLTVLITSGFNLAIPLIIQEVIDKYIGKEINVAAVLAVFIGLIISSIVISITNWILEFVMSFISSRVSRDIRKEAFLKLQKLPIKYYDENAHGAILSILTNDVETINQALSQSIPQFASSILSLIGSLILMFITNWQLTLVNFAVVPFVMYMMYFITSRAFRHFRDFQVQLGAVNAVTKENITGLKAVKLYNQEQVMIEKFKEENEKLRKSGFKAQVYSGFTYPLVGMANNLLYTLLVTIGGFFYVTRGESFISVGKIQSMTNYSKMFTRPASNLAQIFNVIQAAIAGGYRVFSIIDEPHEYQNEEDKEILTSTKGKVEFENVNFSYIPGTPVLKDISFTAKPGQTIAIVGPTGSGKTTIINLLTRFYDIDSGDILIDGRSIYDYTKDSLRSMIGIVLQTTYLFKGTVLENIRYGNPNATFEDVVRAAKLAQVHDIIERLPQKYNTMVKEGGINFSHGERQLISIARTILSNPQILILDEATSSVDTRTEFNIQRSIQEVIKGRTSFVIAHRLQTIRKADIILVIHQGKLIEQGSHEELMAKRGMYYEMYTTQFQDAKV